MINKRSCLEIKPASDEPYKRFSDTNDGVCMSICLLVCLVTGRLVYHGNGDPGPGALPPPRFARGVPMIEPLLCTCFPTCCDVCMVARRRWCSRCLLPHGSSGRMYRRSRRRWTRVDGRGPARPVGALDAIERRGGVGPQQQPNVDIFATNRASILLVTNTSPRKWKQHCNIRSSKFV
jgi:hypothetical protein